MPYIEVDVDLDEFDTDDLVAELASRLGNTGKRGDMKPHQKQAMIKAAKEVLAELKADVSEGKKGKTLEDLLKEELIAGVWNKYSYNQLQNILSC